MIERLHQSVVGLATTSAPSFKKRPDRLSEPAFIDTLVFFEIFKMVCSEAVTRIKQ